MTREEYIAAESDACWRCPHFSMYGGSRNTFCCNCYRIAPSVLPGILKNGGHKMGHVLVVGRSRTFDDEFRSFLLDDGRWKECERFVERLVALSNVEQERR